MHCHRLNLFRRRRYFFGFQCVQPECGDLVVLGAGLVTGFSAAFGVQAGAWEIIVGAGMCGLSNLR